VLGIGLVVVGSAIIFVASFLASSVIADLANSREQEAVTQAVLDFDAAYENQDCAAFRTLVDDALEDQLVDGHFSCRGWVAIADSLRVGDEYGYWVDVVSASVEGNLATVHTEEYDIDSATTYYIYTLERSGGDWVITRYDRD
jgi:hypothetical protein